jgi:branched-chain amino acid aminotransferase
MLALNLPKTELKVISKDGKPGPVSTQLYNKLRGIQYGTEPDIHGWTRVVIS